MKKEFLEPETQILNFIEDTVVCTSDNDGKADDVIPADARSLDNKF